VIVAYFKAVTQNFFLQRMRKTTSSSSSATAAAATEQLTYEPRMKPGTSNT
jgi:hypothetical protein